MDYLGTLPTTSNRIAKYSELVVGSGIVRSINSISANTTAGAALGTDYVYLASGTITLTIPTAVGNTNRYLMKNVGVGIVTLIFTSGQNAEGDTTATFSSGQGIELISNNANYIQIGY